MTTSELYEKLAAAGMLEDGEDADLMADHFATILHALRYHDALVAALRGLNLRDAMEHEGRLEASAYFSCDALRAARDVLTGIDAALREPAPPPPAATVLGAWDRFGLICPGCKRQPDRLREGVRLEPAWCPGCHCWVEVPPPCG